MHTPYDFGASDQQIVYVKAVEVASLPSEVQEQAEAGGLDFLYAVHNEAGEQLALVSDRNTAFVLARQHDFSPVAVH